MNHSARLLILGAGHAGGTLASVLRERGHTGPITLVGDEPYPPYNRPPLSKAYIQGKTELDALLLKTPDYYQEQQIDLLTGATATAIDRAGRQLALADGKTLAYDKLIIATGARPRELPIDGTQLDNVLALRTADDAKQLRIRFAEHGGHAVLIGGGYIGLELAASAISMGLSVTVIERESHLLARVASEPLSRFFQQEHERRGVRFVLATQALALLGTDRVEAIRLSNGETLACDLVLVGAGVVANTELAAEAGLACDNGIVVDLHGQTSAPDIYAIGDVSARPLPLYNHRTARVESVPNAMEQARLVAAHILGQEQPKPEVQWFWSDQYEFKLQIAGMAFECDQTLIRGEPASGKFSVLRLNRGVLQAAECVNSPVDFIGAKQLIASQLPLDTARLTDLSGKLKDALPVTA
ncbi:NAD(P)/FAD-dependent oxidoreductase [Halopseudomonas bauzanensis]|uniref:Ferredoxin reductase n=1 Tax=Halopseudomonas bauzanensis TaxID=653930 RepID=A0A4U0YLM3_9GAMM|nr:FAD-dependent oxidoreductase [Halopseudomonas bauzanensis]TKA92208.1 ferredoxin reductase [Halopseudomonas bauzanensis]